ncbi:gliding motility-associated C-terminal domain-containing protein [Saprospiraceae bacterium]|nr:gliding motility-associated C-terminal domain-containing protein [Saprospiraceae bacterium]
MVIQTNNPDMVASYLRVFDRWGNMVFNLETPWQPFDDMNYPGWNGTYNGQELNPGVYVYVFEFIEEPGATPEVRVGDVTIVK